VAPEFEDSVPVINFRSLAAPLPIIITNLPNIHCQVYLFNYSSTFNMGVFKTNSSQNSIYIPCLLHPYSHVRSSAGTKVGQRDYLN
jgi:hypothetical protein